MSGDTVTDKSTEGHGPARTDSDGRGRASAAAVDRNRVERLGAMIPEEWMDAPQPTPEERERFAERHSSEVRKAVAEETEGRRGAERPSHIRNWAEERERELTGAVAALGARVAYLEGVIRGASGELNAAIVELGLVGMGHPAVQRASLALCLLVEAADERVQGTDPHGPARTDTDGHGDAEGAGAEAGGESELEFYRR